MYYPIKKDMTEGLNLWERIMKFLFHRHEKKTYIISAVYANKVYITEPK